MKRAGHAIAVLACAVQLSLAVENPAPHVHNFGEVNEHIYRGAVPSPVGLQELGAMGIKTVLDLRESGEGTEFEQEEVRRLGMKYINIPMKPFSAPTNAEMQNILAILLHADSERLFVHCRRGKDRTGTVVACYRIQHDGWDNQRALGEAKKYGISIAERGMRSYIIHFSPMLIPQPIKAAN